MGRSRRGRKRDPNAKRRATTTAGRSVIVRMTDEMRAHRIAITGDAAVSDGFPLDALCALGWITGEERDEGLRFTYLCWWRYPMPHASCGPLYDRIKSGFVDDDNGPSRGELEGPDDLARIARRKERLERMEKTLKAAGPGVLEAVKRATQYLVMPKLFLTMLSSGMRSADVNEVERLKRGLEALVVARRAEDQYQRDLPAKIRTWRS